MKNSKLNTLIKISLLSAIAFLLMFIELPIPIFPDFLKIDISDLPALIGAFALGPVPAIIIELLKNILHGIFKGSNTAFIGEMANFIVGSIMVFTAGIIYKKNKTKKGALIGLAVGTIVMSIGAGIFNYFILLPLYEKVLGFPIAAVVGMGAKLNPSITGLFTFIIWSIIPFNLIKGLVVSIVSAAVYKSLSPILHKDITSKKNTVKQN